MHEIRTRLSQVDDPLTVQVRELHALRRHAGEFAMRRQLRLVRREFRQLFPGLAGAELLECDREQP
jgi:hypothetical protein